MLDELYKFKSNKEVIIDILNDEVHAIENVEFFDVRKIIELFQMKFIFLKKEKRL